MKTSALRTLQTALKLPDKEVDGHFSDATRTAIAQTLNAANPASTGNWREWPAERQAVLCLQLLSQQAGFNTGDLDGLWGPQTDYATTQLAYLQSHGQAPAPWREEPVPANPNGWPLERQDDLEAFYGPPGETQLVPCPLPYPLRLAWETQTVVHRIRCHAKVKPSAERVLARVLQHYGLETIRELGLDLYGGAYNYRQKRGGSSLSTHAWGIALDFDPSHNQLKWGRDRAYFARPEYAPWWQCWEAEGWVSLGRTRNYDWMHIQAARL